MKYTTVKDLLADRIRWTDRAFARDTYGSLVNIESKDAVCWCALGALYKCYKGRDGWEAANKLLSVIRRHGYSGVSDVNDLSGYNTIYPMIVEAKI